MDSIYEVYKEEGIQEQIELCLLGNIPYNFAEKLTFQMPTLRQALTLNLFQKRPEIFLYNDFSAYLEFLHFQAEELGPIKELFEKTPSASFILFVLGNEEIFQEQITLFLQLHVYKDFRFAPRENTFYSKELNYFLTIENIAQIIDLGRMAYQIDRGHLIKPDKPEHLMTASEKRLKKFAEKRARVQKEVEKYKKNTSTLDSRILGLVERSHNIDIFNVWDLTLFQFNSLLEQAIAREGYDHYNAMAHSGNFDMSKSTDKPPLHWSEKNKKFENE